MPRRRKRLDPSVFALPVEQIARGIYADPNAASEREIVRVDARASTVLMQFSGEHEGWLGGIDEAVAVLKLCCADWSSLVVNALFEGDRFEAWDTVLTVEGPFEAFAGLAQVCRGALRRRTRVCTNAKRLALSAGTKPVAFLGAGDDVVVTQPGDGYSAMAGGVKLMSTDAQASLFAGRPIGALSHGFIAALGGDTVKAAKRFFAANDGVDMIACVDYDNECVRTSLDVARALEGRLWGVRLDTPANMVDKSVVAAMGTFQPTGVNAPLVWNVRNALDAEGFGEVKIVVAGFDAPRITAFEEDGVPVDVYGVSEALFEGRFDFVADVVQVNGKPQSRAGRTLRENSRMERVK